MPLMEGRRDATRVDRADETTDDEKSLPSQETTVEGGREGGSGAITYTMNGSSTQSRWLFGFLLEVPLTNWAVQ